ncbi:MAG: DeoR/GlpR transcriptional regulator [Clostridia bacterium]|nr:DeoR/GlpR transcriptional regulator [Clostridia bacterium]
MKIKVTPEERKQKILDIINKDGKVKVAYLSQKFGISEVTVRSDLADMEYNGLLKRIHGGAVSSYKPYYTMNLTQRMEANQTGKSIVGKKIASIIENNDTIMLNSGTTTLAVFRSLPEDYNLNIITNSVTIALEAANRPAFNIILLGGLINSKYQFTYGDDTNRQILNYHADKAILSVDGIDKENGYTTYYDKEAEIDRMMLNRSSFKIIAADFTKFNRTAFSKIADICNADIIVTDKAIPDDFDESLIEKCIVFEKNEFTSD